MAPVTIYAVMLANTADREAYEMTSEAIGTLFDSIRNQGITIRLTVVETNPHALEIGEYQNCAVVCPGGPFNYNKFLNFGLQGSAWADYTLILNNDLLFEYGAVSQLIQCMDVYGLTSASPYAPGWPPHEEMLRDDPTLAIKKDIVRVAHEFCGWCLCFRNDILQQILPLDERFVFEFQDVDMLDQLKTLRNFNHGLVFTSRVKHLLNQSHRLIPPERLHEMIEGARQTYLNQ